MNIPYKNYISGAVLDCVLGVVLGLIINKISKYFIQQFNLTPSLGIVIQIILTVNVLYFLKYYSKFLYSSWQGSSHGIIFTSFLIGSQKNISSYLSYIGNKYN